jgi:hypothetical protein
MFKQVFGLSALLIASVSIASAAGGGAGGSAGGAAGGGAHGSGGHGGPSFGKPAVENSTVQGLRARSPCIGAVAVIPTTGGPLPNAPATTNPSPTNGLAAGGAAQSNPDLPRLTQQDEGIIAAIKLANEKLGEVGNPPHGRIDQQPSRPGSVTGPNDGIQRDGIQRRDSGRSRALGPLALGDSSAVKETPDPRMIQGKPDVNHMSEESQRLAREIIRETDKMGRVGNPGGLGRTQPQGESSVGPPSDLRRNATGPRRPTNTMGPASGLGC